jgi:hypothetical protein
MNEQINGWNFKLIFKFLVAINFTMFVIVKRKIICINARNAILELN